MKQSGLSTEVKTAIILGGGKALRLRPLTNNKPKCMVPLCDKPLAEWQLDWLQRQGIRHVVFALGYRWEKVRSHFSTRGENGLTIDYSVEEEPLGTGGALRKAMELTDDETCLALNGDVLTDLSIPDVVKQHLRLRAMATLLVVPFVSPYGIVEVNSDGQVACFVEKPCFSNSWINGGVYVLSHEILPLLPEKGNIEAMTFPSLAEKGQLASFPYQGFWRAVDTLKDLGELEKELAEKLAPPTS